MHAHPPRSPSTQAPRFKVLLSMTSFDLLPALLNLVRFYETGFMSHIPRPSNAFSLEPQVKCPSIGCHTSPHTSSEPLIGGSGSRSGNLVVLVGVDLLATLRLHRPDHGTSPHPREDEAERLAPQIRESVCVADAVRPAQLSTAAQLLAGGIAGAVSKTCTAPLARLTILFQVQGMDSAPGVRLQRPSIMREASRIVREEGFGAFWKGNVVTIVHRLPYSALNFFAYEQYKSWLIGMTGEEWSNRSLPLGMGIKLVAGGGAGITAATATYPLDLVRTRLAAQTKSRYYKGISGTLATIARDEGLPGLYKGLGATLLGVGPAIAINFCVYETLKANWIASRPETPAPLVSLGCGSLAGICSSTATFPLDLVRRRMQLQGAGGRTPTQVMGVPEMFGQIVRKEGILALYRGIIPEYYKVVPGVSIAFMTYEFMKRLLRRPPEDGF